MLTACAVLQRIINLAWPDLQRSRVAKGEPWAQMLTFCMPSHNAVFLPHNLQKHQQQVASEMKMLCALACMLPKKQQLCISIPEDFLLFVHSAYYGLAQHVTG